MLRRSGCKGVARDIIFQRFLDMFFEEEMESVNGVGDKGADDRAVHFTGLGCICEFMAVPGSGLQWLALYSSHNHQLWEFNLIQSVTPI